MDQAKLNRIAMMQRRFCYFAPDFVTAEEHRDLLAWARTMRPHLSEHEPGRRSLKVPMLPEMPDLYTAVRLRLQALLGLEDSDVDPRLGWFLGMGDPGTRIIPHRDPTPEGTQVLRGNLFLQVPERGGLPVIEDSAFAVKDRTLLAFLPSELLHWSQPVEGSKQRIVLSFGYTVPPGFRLPESPQP